MTTHATGWHTHGGECVWPDDRCYVCDAEQLFDPPPNNPSAKPRLVLDPTVARDVIARAIYAHMFEGSGMPADEADCCADAVLAALEATP